MYQTIHDDLFEGLKERNDFRLVERRLNIGTALRQLKNSVRIPMRELVKRTGLNPHSLSTLMQMGEMNTAQERLLKIVHALGVPLEEFVRVARETAHYNFYHLKRGEAPIFKYRTHEVEVYSPPSFSRKDFLWCLIRFYPGKRIENLIHQTMDQVAGFVIHGHLNLKYGDKIYAVHTNQSFFLDPKIRHSFENQALAGTTEFYLAYQLKREPTQEVKTRGRKTGPSPISTALLIEQIRKELSPDPNRLLPNPALAALSGINFDALIHLGYRKTKIIPFEKIDLLANLTDYSFEHIVQKLENRYQGWVKVFTDQDKAVIDLSLRHGVRFTTHTSLGVGKRKFTVSDLTFDPWKEGEVRKEWKYQGIGFLGISVQRGSIGIQYGKQPLKILNWGESLYLNADCNITFVNFLSEEKARETGESAEAKAMIVASPPLV